MLSWMARRARTATSRTTCEPCPPEQLLALASHPSSIVREVLANSLVGRQQAGIAEILELLVDDTSAEVVGAIAELIAAGPESELVASLSDELISKLMAHQTHVVRYKSLLAALGRPSLATQLIGLLKDDDNWGVRERAAKALLGIHSTEIFGALVRSTIEDDDDDVQGASAQALEHALGEEQQTDAIATELVGLPMRKLSKIKALLKQRGVDRHPLLAHLIESLHGSQVDLSRSHFLRNSPGRTPVALP